MGESKAELNSLFVAYLWYESFTDLYSLDCK